jgi:thiopeptide-type bacteriocin biosynthesis protein
VETYHPEIARYGGPTAIDAAEAYFAADSTACWPSSRPDWRRTPPMPAR